MSGSYGSAVLRRHHDGRIEVVSADDVIAISMELLEEALGLATGLYVDHLGNIWLAGDPNYRYRPVRFESPDYPEGSKPVEGRRFLICERVTP